MALLYRVITRITSQYIRWSSNINRRLRESLVRKCEILDVHNQKNCQDMYPTYLWGSTLSKSKALDQKGLYLVPQMCILVPYVYISLPNWYLFKGYWASESWGMYFDPFF